MALERLHVCVTPVVSWTKTPAKWCDRSHPEEYDTIKAAKEACVALGDQCTGVYDQNCDDTGNYKLCKPVPLRDSGTGSCVYAAAGSYAFMHICICINVCMYYV